MSKVFCFLFFVLLVNIDTLVSSRLLSSSSNFYQRSIQQVDEYMPLIIILSIILSVLGIAFFFFPVIAIPQFNISFRKIPLLIVGLLFVKNVLLFIYISRAQGLSRLVSLGLQFFIQLYANIYILRQLTIILEKDNNLTNSLTYIQYYMFFWSLSIFIAEALGDLMVKLSVNEIIFGYLLTSILISVLAYGIFQQLFGNYSEIEQLQSLQQQKKCSKCNDNKRISEIFENLKVLSKQINKIVPLLILSSLTYYLCYWGTLKWSILNGTIDMNNAYGFGILISSIVFNLFSKISLKRSAIIIIVFNVLVNCLVQLDVSSSFMASVLSVLSGFAYSFLLIWIYSTIFLFFEGRYEMFALVLVWMNIGAYAIDMVYSIIVVHLNNQYAFVSIKAICNIVIGFSSIIYIGKFQGRENSFEKMMIAHNVEQVLPLSQRTSPVQLERRNMQGEYLSHQRKSDQSQLDRK